MPMESYIIGGLIGAAIGLAVAGCSAWLTHRGLEKGKTNVVMGAGFLRMLLDLVTLLAVYLLRNVLPFPFYGMIIGTALGLSVGGVLFALRMGKKMKREDPPDPKP